VTDAAVDRAYAKALHLLSFRDHSCWEMRKKLKERGYEDTVLEETLRRLVGSKYLDDASYSERYARHLACNKLYGNMRIKEELRKKGFLREAIDEALISARQEMTEAEGIDLLTRKLRSRYPKEKIEKSAENDRVSHASEQSEKRLIRSLLRKGYAPSLIHEKLKYALEDCLEF